MPGRKALKPRKKPSQERAGVTVDAILEAAAYILMKDGWDQFTTNKVADRAGVNIASLYQYFPNKESIAAELQRRHVQEGQKAYPDMVGRLQSQPDLRAALKMLIDGAIAAHRVNPALHRAFAEELPRSSRRLHGPNDARLIAQLDEILRPYDVQVPDRDIALFLFRTTVHAAIHEAACERPELLENPLFADELILLMERYLVRKPRGKRSP